MKIKSQPAKAAKPAFSHEIFRPPVVVVMGHVDHGKTTLLDAIRNLEKKEKPSALVTKEHGGITQHIGAYQIVHQGKVITFLDTPGHEAFVKMRSRGAQVADIAVLVVAVNEGVKPQTKEAIDHIKETKIPFLIAINKIDLPGASPDMVKTQLAENAVLVEGYGGDIVSVPISAKKAEGIEQLLEMILLVVEMQELKASPKNPLKAYVLDSFLDSRKGIVVNAIVKDGQMKLGETIAAQISNTSEEIIVAKIKAMSNEYGQKLVKVEPGEPVQILGFKKMPLSGAMILSPGQAFPGRGTTTQPVRETGQGEIKKEKDSEGEAKEEPKRILIVLKADVQGTLEAIKASLTEEVKLISEGVGDVTESDILLAESTRAQVIGFNVAIPRAVKKLAEMEKVTIKAYQVIYHLLEDLQKQVLRLLEPTINEEILGEAEVIAEFKIKGNHIAGCKVRSGVINKKERMRLKRGEEVLGESRIVSFQKEKQEVEEVKKNDEVGIVFRPDLPFKLGDVIISYKILEE